MRVTFDVPMYLAREFQAQSIKNGTTVAERLLTFISCEVYGEEDGIRRMKARKLAQFVYLIHACGFHKIGKSKHPEHRLAQLQAGLPFTFTLVRAIPVTDMKHAEKVLHLRFAERRACGEWFKLSDEEVADFMRISPDDLCVPSESASVES